MPCNTNTTETFLLLLCIDWESVISFVMVFVLFFIHLRVRSEGRQLEEQPAVDVRMKNNNPSLVIPLIKTFGPILFVSAIFKLMQDALQFVNPQILK